MTWHPRSLRNCKESRRRLSSKLKKRKKVLTYNILATGLTIVDFSYREQTTKATRGREERGTKVSILWSKGVAWDQNTSWAGPEILVAIAAVLQWDNRAPLNGLRHPFEKTWVVMHWSLFLICNVFFRKVFADVAVNKESAMRGCWKWRTTLEHCKLCCRRCVHSVFVYLLKVSPKQLNKVVASYRIQSALWLMRVSTHLHTATVSQSSTEILYKNTRNHMSTWYMVGAAWFFLCCKCYQGLNATRFLFYNT